MFRRTSAFVFLLGLAAMVAVLSVATASAADVRPRRSIAITQIVEHPSLDAARRGMLEALADAGWVEGETLNVAYESAQGQVATAAQIARKFAGQKPDLIVGISTLSAQTAVAAANGAIPVLFSVVTDPVGAKLVRAVDHPGVPVTGTSDRVPLDQQLDLMRQAVPGLKRIGFVYNPGEPNAVALLKAMKAEATRHDLTVVEAAAPRLSDIYAAGRHVAGKVDALYASTDNTVVSGIESLVKVGYDHKIPVFSGDTDSVERGTAASLGFNYHRLGRLTGEMAVRLLEGADARTMPVETLDAVELSLNPASAARMGLTFSPVLMDRAARVVD